MCITWRMQSKYTHLLHSVWLPPSVATTPLERRGMRNGTEARGQGSCTNTDGHVHQCAISEERHGERGNKRAGARRKKQGNEKEWKSHSRIWIHWAAPGKYHADYLAVSLFFHLILSSDCHLCWFHIWFLKSGTIHSMNSGLSVRVCVCMAERVRCNYQTCFSRLCPELGADTLNVNNVNILYILYVCM